MSEINEKQVLNKKYALVAMGGLTALGVFGGFVLSGAVSSKSEQAVTNRIATYTVNDKPHEVTSDVFDSRAYGLALNNGYGASVKLSDMLLKDYGYDNISDKMVENELKEAKAKFPNASAFDSSVKSQFGSLDNYKTALQFSLRQRAYVNDVLTSAYNGTKANVSLSKSLNTSLKKAVAMQADGYVGEMKLDGYVFNGTLGGSHADDLVKQLNNATNGNAIDPQKFIQDPAFKTSLQQSQVLPRVMWDSVDFAARGVDKDTIRAIGAKASDGKFFAVTDKTGKLTFVLQKTGQEKSSTKNLIKTMSEQIVSGAQQGTDTTGLYAPLMLALQDKVKFTSNYDRMAVNSKLMSNVNDGTKSNSDAAQANQDSTQGGN